MTPDRDRDAANLEPAPLEPALRQRRKHMQQDATAPRGTIRPGAGGMAGREPGEAARAGKAASPFPGGAR